MVEYHLMTDNLDRRKLKEITCNVLHGKKISIKQLNETIFIEARDEKIAEIILGFGKKKSIIFCENIRHANNFKKFIPGSVVYHSKVKPVDVNRDTLERFRRGESQYLLVVNKMNECLDIPDTELIVFLRCTDSKTIFLQQLGRGLRKTIDKRKVVVLDFVANVDRVTERVRQFTPDWTKLETDPHFVKGKGFEFIFTDEEIDLFKILDRLQPRYIADVPELLLEYSEKNLLPANQVAVSTRKLLWWKCQKCGHEKLQTGHYRSRAICKERGRKCSGCNNRVSIQTTHPIVASEYMTKNHTSIINIYFQSCEKFWWKCLKCDHEWRAVVRDRTTRHETGCPACAKLVATPNYNLLTEFPAIAAEYSKKNTVPVTQVTPFSGVKRIWRCLKCQNEWSAIVSNRTKHNTGACPVCKSRKRFI
jgi:DNA-directed RNA polymerase subunit RPC12/RpoP